LGLEIKSIGMIPLHIRGIPNDISDLFIGKVIVDVNDENNYIIQNNANLKVVLSRKKSNFKRLKGVFNLNLEYLTPGDVVIIFPNGSVNTLFRIESENNVVTRN
jgi:hypothetical protein